MTHENDAFSSAEEDTATDLQVVEPLTQVTPNLPVLGSEEPEEDETQLALRNLQEKRAEKRRKKRIKIIAGCAVAGGLVAVLLGRTLLGGGGEQEVEIPPQIAVVERTDFQNVISSSGALKAGSTVVVSPEVDGIIESVRVQEGQDVNKGDVLLTLKNDELDKAVREANQGITEAQQGVNSAQRDLDDAYAAKDEAWAKYNNEEYPAYSRLYADYSATISAAEDAVAPVEPNPKDYKTEDYPDGKDNPEYEEDTKQYEIDLAEYNAIIEAAEAAEEPSAPEAPDDRSLNSAIESAAEGVTSAQSGVTKAQDAYDEAVSTADKRTVTAPSAGTVMSVNATVGSSVGGISGEGGSSDGLVTISNLDTMTVDVEINEIDILSVKKGQWAKVTFSALPDVELDAQVQEVAKLATGSGDGGDGGGIVTFHVGLVIPHPDEQLRPGMTASVRIFTVDIKDALVVPASALTEDEDGTVTVDVVTGGDEELGYETETREVKVGERSSTEAVITEGLEEGETIIASYGGMAAGAGDDEYFDEEF